LEPVDGGEDADGNWVGVDEVGGQEFFASVVVAGVEDCVGIEPGEAGEGGLAQDWLDVRAGAGCWRENPEFGPAGVGGLDEALAGGFVVLDGGDVVHLGVAPHQGAVGGDVPDAKPFGGEVFFDLFAFLRAEDTVVDKDFGQVAAGGVNAGFAAGNGVADADFEGGFSGVEFEGGAAF